MRLLVLIFLVILAGCTPGDSAPEPSGPDATEPSGSDWITLFDGTSLDHFRGYKREDVPSAWSIVDGAMAFTPGSGRGGYIMTREQFGDFELEVEWKISEAGNSGIIYRATEEFDNPWQTGPEYQVLDNLRHPDALYGLDRQAGANYDVHPTDSTAVREVGEWNTARIVADGTHVEHWLNGQMVVSYELYSDDWNARVAASKWADHPEYGRRLSGHISFQDHGDPVFYRAIRIRRLQAD